MKTFDEQNDEIRAQVLRELPEPVGGFESEEATENHRRAQERRFFELAARWVLTGR